jgi:hypothetical protein
MWYIMLRPKMDAAVGTTEENLQYANMKMLRWELHRANATYWRKKDNAERAAATLVLRRPEYIGRLDVVWAKLPGYRR